MTKKEKQMILRMLEREKYIYGLHPEARAYNAAIEKAMKIIIEYSE